MTIDLTPLTEALQSIKNSVSDKRPVKIISVEVFSYEQLSDAATEKALQWHSEASCHDEWWDFIYEDAANIGLKISGFGLDRNRHAEGKFTLDAITVAKNIFENHGSICETFKTAQAFVIDMEGLDKTSDEYEDIARDKEQHFLEALLEDYSVMLQLEADYRQSREYFEEMIEANGYTFTENGKRFG